MNDNFFFFCKILNPPTIIIEGTYAYDIISYKNVGQDIRLMMYWLKMIRKINPGGVKVASISVFTHLFFIFWLVILNSTSVCRELCVPAMNSNPWMITFFPQNHNSPKKIIIIRKIYVIKVLKKSMLLIAFHTGFQTLERINSMDHNLRTCIIQKLTIFLITKYKIICVDTWLGIKTQLKWPNGLWPNTSVLILNNLLHIECSTCPTYKTLR